MKRFLLPILFLTSTAFAQSTPDWRPINRVYKNDGVTVGSVGSAGQIKAGHVLTAKSFPAGVIGNDKLAFWNLENAFTDSSAQSSCASGASGCTLLSSGTAPTGSTGLFGTTNEALAFASGRLYIAGSETFFQPYGSTAFSSGGWFKTSTISVTQGLIGRFLLSGNLCQWYLRVRNTGIVELRAFTDGAGNGESVFYVADMTGMVNTWFHVAVVWNGSELQTYFNGVLTAKAPLTVFGNVAPDFSIGSYDGGNYLSGGADEVFYVKGVALTAQDIRRLYSTRIDHNKNLIAKRQDWNFKRQLGGVAGNPYQSLPFLWYDSTDSNSLFIDLGDLQNSDKLDMRLYDLQQ